MISQRHKWVTCLLCALPVTVGHAVAAPVESALDVCRGLVNEAREVDRVLRTVSDRESGVAAAAELRTRMESLRKGAELLGRLPMDKAEELRLLEQLMRDLTHVTQGYMPVVQRLNEVNAYGADELISVFVFYKMIGPVAGGQSAETPLVREYAGWCDAIDDMLYLLRRAQDVSTATAVGAELSAACDKAERRAEQVESLQHGLSPQQLESERVPLARLQTQRAELRMELRRLQGVNCFGVTGLQNLLQRCSRSCRN